MPDTHNLTTIPTAKDEIQASVEAVKRALPVVAELAPQIAALRRQMFDAHIQAGFSEAQALELCKSLSFS